MLAKGAYICRAETGSDQSLAGLWRALFYDPLRAKLFLPSIIAQTFALIYIFGHEFRELDGGGVGTLKGWNVSTLAGCGTRGK